MVQYWFEDDLGSNNSGYYELQAVLTHKGRSSNSGHYVAWVKYKGDTWIECNDDEVRPVHVEDVMKLSGGGKFKLIFREFDLIFSKTLFAGDWHTAYLLLYGPRKLPKDFKKADQESEAKEANVEKMET